MEPFRPLVAPLIIGSILCTGLLFGGDMMDGRRPYLADYATVWAAMLAFVGLGYLLLAPVARAIFNGVEQQWLRLSLVALAGALIAVVLILPISIAAPTYPGVLLPISLGAVSALIWFAFNGRSAGLKS